MAPKTLSARPGKVGKEVRAAVRELGEPSGLQRIDVVIAERTADVVDGAYRSDDPRLALAALRDLRSAVARLAVEEPGDGRESDAGAGGEPERDDPMARVLGAGPEVRDTPDA